MISLPIAQELKKAGLVWRTGINDFFAIPDRGMDDKVFVISDLMVTMELLRGWPALTFHGTSEWAADHLFTNEAIWLPTDEQLSREIIARLPLEKSSRLSLSFENGAFKCTIALAGVVKTFTANSSSLGYAQALLHLLEQEHTF